MVSNCVSRCFGCFNFTDAVHTVLRREANCDVVTIAYHEVTGICLQDLKMKLAEYADRKMKIGSFSACSNVTGL